MATAAETAAAVAEIETRGYTVLRGAMGGEWAARCRTEFDAVLSDFAAHTEPNRGPARYYMNVPPVQPFLDPLAEPRTNAILGAMLGDDFVVENLASDTPLGTGSEAQLFHQDGVQLPDIRLKLGHRTEPLELEAPQMPTAPWTLIANVALSDITEQDGPFMIVPGSQALSVEETERRLEAGTLALEPVCPMRAGDIFVRNPHCVHRGSASERDARRPMLAYIFTKPSHFASWSLRTHAISERVLGSLEPDVQRMLRMIPRAGAEAELLQGYNSGEDMAQELAKL